MKKLITIMLLLVGFMQSTYAQEPYAVLSEDNTTLIFYYDNNKDSKGGMGVGPFSSAEDRGWNGQREKITTVVFDTSFGNCNTVIWAAYWFSGCSKLTSVNGLENLNSANVQSMYGMFKGCSALTNLNLRNLNTSNVEYLGARFSG